METTTRLLPLKHARDIARRRGALDPDVLIRATEIVSDVRRDGEPAVRRYAQRFDGVAPDAPLLLGPEPLQRALAGLDAETRGVLDRTAERVMTFARAQRATTTDLDTSITGGRAGHTLVPIEAAGCYAPAGRYPLPSSVLMTAVTARAAGCERVVVASPSTDPLMLAAAGVSGADAYLPLGGAHAVAALAYGFAGFDPVDIIAGPGNAWVTAAKHAVSADVAIDMLAGPSELLVIADESADPELIAADLLAQAEHDPDASAMLVTTDRSMPDAVEAALDRQLRALPTRDTALLALANGFTCVVGSLDEARDAADTIAAEHVEVLVRDAEAFAAGMRHGGAVFLGPHSAEVFGDYGAGPNHTLPTGGTARSSAGLSVLTFLRARTWLSLEDPGALAPDATAMARLEGLEAHARAAERRA
ncbi:MAG: histidinol dehydrogenase [Phycisphaera sp.]|nr:MAG: histidinol dehydrogenase [Phycisphaera sp.]